MRALGVMVGNAPGAIACAGVIYAFASRTLPAPPGLDILFYGLLAPAGAFCGYWFGKWPKVRHPKWAIPIALALVGSIAGYWVMYTTISSPGVLWIVAEMVVFAAILFCLFTAAKAAGLSIYSRWWPGPDWGGAE
jgi:hypothetical protein